MLLSCLDNREKGMMDPIVINGSNIFSDYMNVKLFTITTIGLIALCLS